MHAAAALGVRECRWPDDCRIYKPRHENLSNARISQVWSSWQRALDKVLSQRVGREAALGARIFFDYPRRKIRGVESVIGPSIERNFVAPASRWALGSKPPAWQPENWGLGNHPTRTEKGAAESQTFSRSSRLKASSADLGDCPCSFPTPPKGNRCVLVKVLLQRARRVGRWEICLFGNGFGVQGEPRLRFPSRYGLISPA